MVGQEDRKSKTGNQAQRSLAIYVSKLEWKHNFSYINIFFCTADVYFAWALMSKGDGEHWSPKPKVYVLSYL